MEGSPLWWVCTHRMHHQHRDEEEDPHSPQENFFWGHMEWIYTADPRRNSLDTYAKYVPDLMGDRFLRWLHRGEKWLLVWALHALHHHRGRLRPRLPDRGHDRARRADRRAGVRVGHPGPHRVRLAHHLARELRVAPLGLPELRDQRPQPQQLVRRAARPTAKGGTTTTTRRRGPARRATAGGRSTSRSPSCGCCKRSASRGTWSRCACRNTSRTPCAKGPSHPFESVAPAFCRCRPHWQECQCHDIRLTDIMAPRGAPCD